PDSILKCTNKVYLNELLSRHRVPVPKTLMVHRDNVDRIVPLLGLPCIVKQPDSAFSRGVAKIETEDALADALERLFARSDLVIAQQWLPTTFDWRVGVYDRRPLYVCKYFMAPGHWQVVKRESGRTLEGSTQALSVGEAPESVVRTAVRAANLIGDGLYGVDLKQDGQQCYVMEVNDNPNIDAGNEDMVLKDALYRELMGVFLRRIQERKRVAS
ncbi:MAG: ATP-grasp domain-containing protein, partial [Betaproteobacteria bacterium]